MRALLDSLKQLRRYPSAVVGLCIIFALVVIAIYTVIAIPYGEAIRLWRGGEDVWQENPRNAQPRWVNIFRTHKLPETIVLSALVGERTELGFDFEFDDFPSEVTLFFEATFKERRPYVSLFWRTPDGREISLGGRSVSAKDRYNISLDNKLERRLQLPPERGLFADKGTQKPLKGRYSLIIEGVLFEPNSSLKAKLVVYGKVHGLAGTDHKRRDLMVALLWGVPIALAFGLLAAVGSTITTMIIAAIGVWYGRWIDTAIQRITEINMILPGLPILIMVGTFYSRSIWVVLGVLIALGIFSGGIKTYRAMFLQVKESPYIEAARAYGAGGLRIVFQYMIPRMIPVLIPGFVIMIPGLIFTEASLAVLGLGDPVLPTWGKVLQDASSQGALYKGYYYWVLEPASLLMLTGFGFAMVGFALDRIFNPRLREL